jgi:hypothetical protein
MASPQNPLEFLFGPSRPVSPRMYALTGFSLAALKYAVDAGLVYA